MGITVGDIFTQFPNFRPEDMRKLVGHSNYNGRTTIQLNKIASYQGANAQDLSVFVASREKENYTKLLSENRKTEVNQQIGIGSKENSQGKKESLPAYIPMDKSVFDYQKSQIA